MRLTFMFGIIVVSLCFTSLLLSGPENVAMGAQEETLGSEIINIKDWTQYADDELAVSYPQNWVQKQGEGPVKILLRPPGEEGRGVGVWVVAEHFPGSLHDYIGLAKSSLAAQEQEYRVLGESDRTLIFVNAQGQTTSIPAYLISDQFFNGEQRVRQNQLLMVEQERAYVVVAVAPEDTWAQWEPTFETIFDSFFLNEKNEVRTAEETALQDKPASLMSLEEAAKRAKDYARLAPPVYHSAHEATLVYDSEQRPWYVLDFTRLNLGQRKWYWEKRVVVNPYDGSVVTDEKVLRDLGAAEGVLPAANIDPLTKEILITVSPQEASQRAAEYAQLAPEYVPQEGQLWYDNLFQPWYLVDLMRSDEATKKWFWKKRVVISAWDGSLLTDAEILKEVSAGEGDVPPGVDPATKALLLKTSFFENFNALLQKRVVQVGLLFFLLAVIGAAIHWRKKIGPRLFDAAFAVATLAQLFLAYYFFRYGSPEQGVYIAIILLTSSFGTLTSWIITRAYLKISPATKIEELTVIPPKDLPKFSDLGGMERVKGELRNTVGFMISKGKLAQRYGVNFNGVLLVGPPGVGKSYLAKAAAGEFGLNFLSLKVSDLIGGYFGTSTTNIDMAFKTALKHAPCLLFFDEFDSIAAERGVVSPALEDTRIVNQLLRSLEEIRSHPGKVVVFAATNSKDDLDEAVIRSGRFDKHIFIPLPDDNARKAIIETRLKGKPVAQTLNLDELVLKTDGMSAADIAAIIDKAVLGILGASISEEENIKELDQQQLVEAIVNFRDKQKPSVKRLTWDDLILQDEVIAELKRLVKVIENPDMTQRLGIEPPKGILLYGPPGTGKTTVAKVIANEAHASFFSISPSDVYSKWLGESERNVNKIFEEARRYKPSIIFIDEIDALMGKRGAWEGAVWADKLVNQILQEIDGIKDTAHVFIIGATNAPDAVDPALLRGGRLSIQIEIPLPGKPEREKLFELFLIKTQQASDVNVEELTDLTDGYSGADIKEICHRAMLDVFDRSEGKATEMTQEDLRRSIQKYTKSSKVYRVPEYFKGPIGFRP